MNFIETQLKTLVRFLEAQKVKYAVLGGIAVSIYGEPRLTADIDVNIIFGKNDIDMFIDKAKDYGIYPFSNTKIITNKTGVVPLEYIKGEAIGRIDFILAENALEYAAIRRSRVKKIARVKVRLISPEDLILHKIASTRPRDIEDAKGILMRQSGKIDLKYIKNWLRRIDKVDKDSNLYKLFVNLSKNARLAI